MPRIKRYHPVSHDLNSDPETWELTAKFGDRALRVWLEILSIADRNNGFVGHGSDQLYAVFATRCRVYSPKVRAIFVWCLGTGWLVDRDGFRVANYSDYHRTRGPNQAPSEHPSEHPNPSEPNHLKKDDSKIPLKRHTNKSPYPENFKISDQLREWCGKQRANDPDRELEAFRDFHIAKGSRFNDWDAAFRNWIRNSFKFNRQGQSAQAEGNLSERTLKILRRGL